MLGYSVPLHKIGLLGLIIAFLLTLLPFLFFEILRVFYATPIDGNEGFMTIHTNRFLAGRSLYEVPSSGVLLTPENYPPLSFVVVGTLSYFTGSILLTGRLVSLLSFLFSAYLIYGIVLNLSFIRSAAVLGALLWIALMVQHAGHYVGTYDPQMFGHVFSLAALYLYSKWIDELTPKKVCALAFLCCWALFIKHLLIAVPITLAITLCVTNRKAFVIFDFAGAAFFMMLIIGSWIYGGEAFFSNFLEFDRPASIERMNRTILKIFHWYHLWVLFFPFIMLFFQRQSTKWLFILIYFPFSLLLGAYASRGAGVDINAWFDFFMAAAVVFGITAAEHQKEAVHKSAFRPVQEINHHTPRSAIRVARQNPIVTYGILALCLLPFLHNLKAKLTPVLSYEELSQQEAAYKKDVVLLKSIPGPVLYEELLLGFEAGKEFLVDTHNVARMITSGRIPEDILLDPIRSKYFSAVVLNFDVEKALAKRSNSISEQWTHNTLTTIRDNYRMLAPDSSHQHFFYLPR